MFGTLTLTIWFYAPDILSALQIHLHQKLTFFGVMEPVIALLKLSSATALALMAPWVAWRVSGALSAVFGMGRKFALIFALSGLLLFYAGASFCFFITLPFGINFLLGYQSDILRPVISIEKFVDFAGLFLLGFGVIFELPLIMTLLSRLRIVQYRTFTRHRRYAVLIIAIMAAALTPTPDVFNMALMGIPLYLLFEAGIIFARLASPGE
jgi:sec-independent protein translocase protein TatC